MRANTAAPMIVTSQQLPSVGGWVKFNLERQNSIYYMELKERTSEICCTMGLQRGIGSKWWLIAVR